MENRMNIVQVTHFEDRSQKRYTFEVPSGVLLEKVDIVLCQNRNGKTSLAKCVTNSEILPMNIVDMIMGGKPVVSHIAGVYHLVKFATF